MLAFALAQAAAPTAAPPVAVRPTLPPAQTRPAPVPARPTLPPPAPGAAPVDPKVLGARVAASGAFMDLARLALEKDIRELLDANRAMPTADQLALTRIATDKAAEAQKKLIATTGELYARELSVADMQAIIAFNESPAAARWRAVQPRAVAAVQQGMAGYDFKREVLDVMCFRTRKMCPQPERK